MGFGTWIVAAAVLAILAVNQIEASENEEGPVLVHDPAFLNLIDKDAKLEKLADGFRFTEGPVWVREGYLVFSDIPANKAYKWCNNEGISVYRDPSQFSNGMTLDKDGRLIVCEHGSRKLTRREADGTFTTLADRFEGKLLNSPNDAARFWDGSLFFTDPPYGIPAEAKELDFHGVYRYRPGIGSLELLTKDFDMPNGLAFSPDFKTLYINDSSSRVHMRKFEVSSDGKLSGGEVFATLKSDLPGLPDGLKTDVDGNVWTTGPMGIWVYAPDGTHLGTIRTPEVPANCAWGDPDGKSFYITATKGLYRIRTKVGGILP